METALERSQPEQRAIGQARCMYFQNAMKNGTDSEGYGPLIHQPRSGGFIMGEDLPPMLFCPWCGTSLKYDYKPNSNNLQKLRLRISETDHWHYAMMAAHGAIVKMGTFQKPLEQSLMGITYGQWKLEQSRRVVLAVIDYLLSLPSEKT